MFEEALVRSVKVEAFPRSSIDFGLYVSYKLVCKLTYICSFRYVLSYQLISVFDISILP